MYLYIFTFRYTEVAGWLCIYICECKQRVYICMYIFTYMSSRSDVGVYVGWVGTQFACGCVCVCVGSHGVTCGFKYFYLFTYIHTVFTHMWVYILKYILPGFTCVCVYI